MNKSIEIQKFLKYLIQGTKFEKNTYLVGGCVRDRILGLDPKDVDVVIEIDGGSKELTHQIHSRFPKSTTAPIQTGENYPIYRIHIKDNIQDFEIGDFEVEFADTMIEEFLDSQSRQRSVKFGTLQQDIERRDFTVNSLLIHIASDEIVDLSKVGQSDLRLGILRCNPNVSVDKILIDDPLRSLRLVRFHCKYGWKIDQDTFEGAMRNAHRISIVSAERVMDEFVKIMNIGKLREAIILMRNLGLLKHILPEVEAMIGVEQPIAFHSEGDVLVHSLKSLEYAKLGVCEQLSVLLHDIGKPSTNVVTDDGKTHFYKHEYVGAKIVEKMLRRLKFDLKTIETVKCAVENHMRPHSLGGASMSAYRRYLRDLGEEMAFFVLDVSDADEKGSLPYLGEIPKIREKLIEAKNWKIPVRRTAVLDGFEIMETLGLKPGPKIGAVTKWLLENEDEYAERGEEINKDLAKMLIKVNEGIF